FYSIKTNKTVSALSMRISVIIFLCFIGSSCFAQTPAKVIHNRSQAWFGYLNQTRFTDKWGMWLDVHYRMTDNFVDRPFQFLFRPAVTYFVKDNLRLNVGYTLVKHFPGEGLHAT